MEPQRDAAILAGAELRQARVAGRLRQRDVAEAIGCSQATISRMELGRGGWFSMALWAAAAAAVERRLTVDLVAETPRSDPEPSLALRCHRTVAMAAREGGWSIVTEIEHRGDRQVIETVMLRGQECAVVHAWDVVGEVEARMTAIRESVDRQAADGAPLVAGLVIVPSRPGNRRRMTEAAASLQSALPTLAADWFAALRVPARKMPARSGVLWLDKNGVRLLPAPLVPGWAWIMPDRGSRALGRHPSIRARLAP